MDNEFINCRAWEELMATLYSEDDKTKLEWCIGAVASWDGNWLKKLVVFYGDPGTGKSTTLNIIRKMFNGLAIVLDEPEKMTATEQFKKILINGDLGHTEAFTFASTNEPIILTVDTRRHLISIHTSGNTFSKSRYEELYSKIDSEIDAIIKKCIDVYQSMGPHYYDVIGGN